MQTIELDIEWASSQGTKRFLATLETIRIAKLTQAAAWTKQGCTDLQLRLLLNEANVVREVIEIIQGTLTPQTKPLVKN